MTVFDLERAVWTISVACVNNVSCALLGCFLVLRRMSLLGDAISHAVLPGIALGFLFTGSVSGWPIILGAMSLGLLTSFLSETVHKVSKTPEDASLGVVFSALFAVGVILISGFARHADLDPGCVLYGLIQMVALDTAPVLGLELPRALLTLLPVLLLVIGFIALCWKELQVASFDPALASAMGFPAGLVHYLLMAMVAGATVAAFESVGAILVVAMLIVPGAIAHLLTDRLAAMLLWASAVAVVSAAVGYVLNEWLNAELAGMMAVVAGAQLALAVFFAPQHGLASSGIRNFRLAVRIAAEDMLGLLYRQEEAASRGEAAAAGLSAAELRRAVPGLAGRLALPRLLRKGQVRRRDDGTAELTAEGRRRASALVRAHRLWERYLETHANLPLDHLHAAAHRMEHFIGPEMQAELAAELHQPARDPHGREIPKE